MGERGAPQISRLGRGHLHALVRKVLHVRLGRIHNPGRVDRHVQPTSGLELVGQSDEKVVEGAFGDAVGRAVAGSLDGAFNAQRKTQTSVSFLTLNV